MTMCNTIKTLVLAALALFHGALLAQETSEEDPHAALALAFSSEEIALLRFEQDMKISFSVGLKQIPEMAQMERECPGFISGLGKAMRPAMREGHIEDNAWYREQLYKLFRERLSKDDAADAAQFYGSDEGQNLLAQAILNMRAENTIAEIARDIDEETPLSAEAYKADQAATANRLLKSMSEEELQAIGRMLQGAEWFPRFLALSPEIQDLGLQVFNREYSPELDAKIDAVAENFTNAHFEACEAP